jgi:hypothetical protein
MRTTIDLPEQLLRRAKAHAALNGLSLKDFVADAVRVALAEGEEGNVTKSQSDELDLGSGCSFPLIRGATGSALRGVTLKKLYAILEDEDAERAAR